MPAKYYYIVTAEEYFKSFKDQNSEIYLHRWKSKAHKEVGDPVYQHSNTNGIWPGILTK